MPVSTYIKQKWNSITGTTFMRIPDVAPEVLWEKIIEISDSDKKSLITFLRSVSHPSAEPLQKLYDTWVEHHIHPKRIASKF